MRTLSVVPVGLLSSAYDVIQEGGTVGRIKNRAGFQGALVARSAKMPSLSEEYDISFGGRNIRLKKKTLSMRESFIISDGSGGVGSFVQESLISRRLRCEIDSDEREIPREIMLFLAWLALIIRKKDAASAG